MCLVVTDIPLRQCDGVIVPVFKKLVRYYSKLLTPFMNVTVPDNGFLFPDLQFRQKIWYDTFVEGGVIHSLYSALPPGSRGFWRAYAIGVIAYEVNDVASLVLYIPQADKTVQKEQRLKLIKNVLAKPVEQHRKDHLYPLHPGIKEALNEYGTQWT